MTTTVPTAIPTRLRSRPCLSTCRISTAGFGSQSDLNAELRRTLCHGVRDHTVNADRRQHQSKQREHRQDERQEARPRTGCGYDVLHRPNFCHGQTWVERPYHAAHRIGELRRISGGPHQQLWGAQVISLSVVVVGQEKFRTRRPVGARVLNVCHHADYRVPAFSSPGFTRCPIAL